MWWSSHSGLPLPLGVNAVRSDLDTLHGEGTLETVNSDLTRCLEFTLEHREQALAHAMRFARDLTPQLTGQFIDMYVNRWTLDLGSVGKAAIRTFLEEAHRAGVGPDPAGVEFVG
jgi:1,4-dihydroxy-6-naphthoate synthase